MGKKNPGLNDQVRAAFDAAPDKQAFLRGLRDFLHELSPQKDQPVDNIRWVPVEKVFANDYNPNSVAKNEMRLLHTSIKHDGYTQPVVTVYDPENDRYVIVDGFHRYTTMRVNDDIRAMCNGLLPIVVIDKPINDRMASTVRHNRARGKHSVSGMASMVFQMLENGWSDEAICAELGLEVDELIRLKHVTGFSKLFADVEYRRSWETNDQIRLRVAHERLAQAARKSSSVGKKAGGDAAGEEATDLEDAYKDQRATSTPTNESIAARQRTMAGYFREVVAKAEADLAGVDCPACGEAFYIDRKAVANAGGVKSKALVADAPVDPS